MFGLVWVQIRFGAVPLIRVDQVLSAKRCRIWTGSEWQVAKQHYCSFRPSVVVLTLRIKG